MSDSSVVLVTAPSEGLARELALRLVSEQLVACGNVLPGVYSVYRWQGAIEEAQEVMLMLKTRRELVAAVAARVRELHPYDVPEVIALPIEGGLPGYLEWIHSSTEK